MRTSSLRRFAKVNRQFKYRKREKIRNKSFPRLRFNLPAFFYFSLLLFPLSSSSISSFGIMMKFLGNWVKCAYTMFCSSSLSSFFSRFFYYYQMQFFHCNSFFISLNLHDMSAALSLVRYFQLNYSTTTKILYKYFFFLSHSFCCTKFQMSCLIKRIKYMKKSLHLALRFRHKKEGKWVLLSRKRGEREIEMEGKHQTRCARAFVFM